MYLEEVNFFRMMSLFELDDTDSDTLDVKPVSKIRLVALMVYVFHATEMFYPRL